MTHFHLLISDWYRQNKRPLPWRETQNPYFIWLSEIILQQTRVNQGMNYYLKFVQNYPLIENLAEADEQKVLSDWQGLGYYSRARNLHHTAKTVVEKFGGKFPDNFKDIKSLKGIGDYTAAAIASFAYDLPHAVVDGNVYRVLSRVFDIETPIDTTEGKKVFDALAAELLNPEHPALHNQAIMEFGALQCVPVNPDCQVCPLVEDCQAFRNGTVAERPRKIGKIKVRNRYFHFLQFEDAQHVVLEKRTKKDIWQHLFQFPLVELEEPGALETVSVLIRDIAGVAPNAVSEPIRHILTHQRIEAHVWSFDALPEKSFMAKGWIIVPKKDIADFPIPRLLDRYLEHQN
jgi:A/G-specific adenine glycosylase